MQALDLQQLKLIFYLLLGLIAIILGGLIAYVVIAGRREREKLAQTQKLESLVPRPALQVTGQVLNLVRNAPGGPLQVEIAGKRYRRLDEIEDKQLRRQVVDAAMELIWFTGALGSDASAPTPLEQTYHWREDVRKGSKGELEHIRSTADDRTSDQDALRDVGRGADTIVPEDVEEKFLDLLSNMGHASPGVETPSLVSALQRRWTPKPSDRDEPRTFVDQIDRIIQRRIQLIPALAQRELHVWPGPGGVVRFVFEGVEYEDLDDLPNLTARQVIKDAIQEWDETS